MLRNKITVVVPCYNEVNYIGELLRDLRNQDGSSGLRVIVADAKSNDGTRELLGRIIDSEDRLEITVVEGGMVSFARNTGLLLVETPYVIFIDSDVRVKNPSHLQDVVRKLRRKKLVGSRLRSASGIKSDLVYISFNIFNFFLCRFKPFVVGSFFATHTEHVKSLGGWDETIFHGEDWLLSSRYDPRDFCCSSFPVHVDDRRFKKTGYLGMLILMLKSAILGSSFMRKDHGYWD